MILTPPKCECTGPGYCKRHKCEKIEALWKLCEQPDFWRQFESGTAPQQLRRPTDTTCIHRGDETRRVLCNTCNDKKVELKVLACSVHGECAFGNVPDVKSCFTCTDRVSELAERIIIQNNQSPGDIAVLAGAVRALHENYPGQYVVSVRTPCNQIFEASPYITKFDDGRVVDATYNGIHQSGQRPIHFLQAYCDDLARSLGIPGLTPKDWNQPAIFLSDEEKSWHSQVKEITGDDRPFWIINAGIKTDYTAKKWNGWQRVIELTWPHIQWVQVGSKEKNHRHPELTQEAPGVIDLYGETDLRQLIRLVYHSQGVLCGVTALMHLAHWVERGPHNPRRRHAVIVAGGREPPSWFTYPGHKVFHTIGELDCCANSGCWKSRVLPENDGDDKDKDLCVHPAGDVGRCMEMIDPADVVRTVLRLAGYETENPF